MTKHNQNLLEQFLFSGFTQNKFLSVTIYKIGMFGVAFCLHFHFINGSELSFTVKVNFKNQNQ
jgi:succinate dehydrogenase/fumarate reductase cytochrome b subunit